MFDKVITVNARPNLALVKYWGKRRQGEDCQDPALNLPQNSSFSITLDAGNELLTKTSVVFSEKFEEDMFYLNGKKQDMNDPELQERFLALEKLRKLARTKTKALVVSNNSFPTASGLASSASGLSAMIFAASKALGLEISMEKLSEITRIGSGSACRSLFGGFVVWDRGEKPDGSDSVARQIFDENYWSDLRIVICLTTQEKKKVSSRSGMKQTVATSNLYKVRPAIAEENVRSIESAAKKKDFETFGKIIMTDAMNMHATMMDTRPPIIYINDISKEIIYAVEELNEEEGRIVGAYTFDAGPNACIICLEKDVNKIIRKLESVEGIRNVMKAKVGKGPELLSDDQNSLIDMKELVPVS
jgi:diphosphomevalonate decarboxylase